MQPNETRIPSPKFKVAAGAEKNERLATAALLLQGGSDGGSDDEGDQTTTVIADEGLCGQCIRRIYRQIVPDATPFYMYCALFVIILLNAFVHASEARRPHIVFYGVYLGVSGSLLLSVLLIRCLWINFFNKIFHIPTGLLSSAVLTVLDPSSTYLAFTITLIVFWDNALVVVHDPNMTDNEIKYEMLGNPKWVLYAAPDDRTLQRAMEIVLIIWATRNLLVNLLMFYFLIGFLKNVNPTLVKFLTMYSLLRKLNANWIRLTPVLNEMVNPTNIEEEGMNEDTTQYQKMTGPFSPKRGIVEAPFGGPTSAYITVPAASMSPSSTKIIDEFIAAGAAAKEGKKSASAQSHSVLAATLSRIREGTQLGISKARKKKLLRERYHVEFTGRALPSVMLRKNILKSERSGITNLLSIQYVRMNPVVLFVRGTRTELHSRKLAKLVGKRLFEELVEFRNSMAPEIDDMGPKEKDQLVKQSILQTLELNSQRQQSFQSEAISLQKRTPIQTTEAIITEGKISEIPQVVDSFQEKGAIIAGKGLHVEDQQKNVSLPPLPDLQSSEQNQSFQPNETGAARVPFAKEPKDDERPPPKKDIEQASPVSTIMRPDATHQAPPADDTPASTEQKEPKIVYGGPAIHLKKYQKRPPPEKYFLTREIFELFMGNQVDEFMLYADPGGRDQVSRHEFVRMIVELYEARKQLILLVDSQEGIRNVFKRVISILLSFFALLVFLVVAGVSVNTIVISGAASLSSFTVALSFLYSGFIQSVLFVCFLNPYNVNDRIRLGGQFNNSLFVVRKVTTYFTQFESVHGIPVFLNHSVLYETRITNESRSRHGGLEIPLFVAWSTPSSKYEALHHTVVEHVQTHGEYVKDSCFVLMGTVVVGDSIQFTYWVSCTESWHNWKACWGARARLLQVIIRTCKELDITYRLPLQPLIGIGSTADKLLQMKNEPLTALEMKVADSPSPSRTKSK